MRESYIVTCRIRLRQLDAKIFAGALPPPQSEFKDSEFRSAANHDHIFCPPLHHNSLQELANHIQSMENERGELVDL